MTEFEAQMLAKMDALLAEMREIKEIVKRPTLTLIHGGQQARGNPIATPRDDNKKFW